MKTLDIQDIKNLLPHRYPFLLVDRVTDSVVGERLTAIKNVTVNEPFFEGHFPHRPVMPGVLILEAMAQSSAILASFDLDKIDNINRLYYFVGIDKARFKRPVEPGDQLVFDVKLVRRIKNMWKCEGVATVDGDVAAKAELMFTYQDV